VCNIHGGKRPETIAAARRRLLAMVDPALDALLRALKMGNPCEHCGRSDDMGIVVRAAQIVLDRTGFHPSRTIEVAPVKAPAWSRFLTEGELAQINEMTTRAKQRMLAAQNPDVVDAVLVESTPAPPEALPTGNEPPSGEVDG
jgi:hypothetical protein